MRKYIGRKENKRGGKGREEKRREGKGREGKGKVWIEREKVLKEVNNLAQSYMLCITVDKTAQIQGYSPLCSNTDRAVVAVVG